MKVLHVAPYTDQAYGGPGVAIRAMAQAMVQHGADVHIATTSAAGDKELQWEDGATDVENGVQFRYFHRTFPRSWFRAPSMARWLETHAANYNLLHLHVPFTAPLRAGALAAREARRPYIITPHGVLDPWCLAQKAWKKRPYLRLLENKVLSGAAALHVTAPLEQGFVDRMKLGPAVWCLPLAVPQLSESPERRRDWHGRQRLLCIARLHPVKALPVLFAALARLRADGSDVVLDMAGEGDTSYVSLLKRLAHTLGLDDAIIWHGYVNGVQKAALYDVASCFALLSHHENFGLAAAEAMAAGVPVVVSDQVGLAPDVIAFKAGEVVPVGDVSAAERAIRRVMIPETRLVSGTRARQLVEQRYGADAFADGLAAMYQSVLSNK